MSRRSDQKEEAIPTFESKDPDMNIDAKEALKKIKEVLPQKITGNLQTKTEVRIKRKLNKILNEVKHRRDVSRRTRGQLASVFSTNQSNRESVITKKQLADFYERFDKSKRPSDIEKIINAYRTDELVALLEGKYGEAPVPMEITEAIITKQQLVQFYNKHDPANLSMVKEILAAYRTVDLVDALRSKYGEAPTPVPKTEVHRTFESAKNQIQHEIDSERAGWQAMYDDHSNAFYYLDLKTNESVWTKPDDYVMKGTEEEIMAVVSIQTAFRKQHARHTAKKTQIKNFQNWKSEFDAVVSQVQQEKDKKEAERLLQIERKKEREAKAIHDALKRSEAAAMQNKRFQANQQRLAEAQAEEERPPLLQMLDKRVEQIRQWWLKYQGLDSIPDDDSDIAYLDQMEGWREPNVQQARKHRDKMLYQGGEAPVWSTKTDDMGGAMGVGMALYFIFIRKLTRYFFVATILIAPCLVLNYFGQGLQLDKRDLVTRLTLANQGLDMSNMDAGFCEDNSTIRRAICNGTIVEVYGFPIPTSFVAYTMGLSDFLYSFLFLLVTLSFRKRIDAEVVAADESKISGADFSIFVRGLPRDASEAMIRDHFSERYDLSIKRCFYPHVFGCFGAPLDEDSDDEEQQMPPALYHLHERQRYPTMNEDNVDGNKDYHKSWVSEVSVAHPNGQQIRIFLANIKLSKKIRIAELNVKKFSMDTSWKDGPDPGNRARAVKQLRKLKSKMRKLNERVKKRESGTRQNPLDICTCAFVVFNNEESYAHCLDDYRTSDPFLSRMFQPKDLRFADKRGDLWTLQVVAAPEPDDIKWENLEDEATERTIRKLISTSITILILLASFVFSLLVRGVQQKAAEQTGDLGLCEHLPAQYFGNYSFANYSVDHFPEQDAQCQEFRADSHYIGYKQAVASAVNPGWRTDLTYHSPLTGKIYGPSHLCMSGTLHDSCLLDSDTNQTSDICWTLPCYVDNYRTGGREGKECQQFSRSAALGCYCNDKLQQSIKEIGLIKAVHQMLTENVVCKSFANQYMQAEILKNAQALFVIIINVLLQASMVSLTEFERHHTKSAYMSSLTRKIFLSQFLNTALIVLLVNAHLPNGHDEYNPLAGYSVFTGFNDDFSRHWYSTVGFAVTQTMMINILAPHFKPMQLLIRDLFNRRVMTKHVKNQEQMNEMFEGPEFRLEERYPVFLNSLFVTLFYCAGIPVLIPFAAISYGMSYLVDKYMLLRVYRKPHFDHSLASMTGSLMPVALCMHLVIATWMYGNPSLISSEQISMQIVTDPVVFFGFDDDAKFDDDDLRPVKETAGLDFLQSLLSAGVNMDPTGTPYCLATIDPRECRLGYVERASYLHVFPVGLFGVILMISIIYRATAGKLIYLALNSVIAIISCGQFGNNAGRVEPERIPISAYTETFAQIHVGNPKPLSDKQRQLGWAFERGPPKDSDKFLKMKRRRNVGDEDETSEDYSETEEEPEDQEERERAKMKQLRQDMYNQKKHKTRRCRGARKIYYCLRRCFCTKDINPDEVFTLYRVWKESGQHKLGNVRYQAVEGDRRLTWQAMDTLPSYKIMCNQEYALALSFKPSHRKRSMAEMMEAGDWDLPEMAPMQSPKELEVQGQAVDAILNRLETFVGFSQITYLISTIDVEWPDTFVSLSRFLGILYFDVTMFKGLHSTSMKLACLAIFSTLIVLPVFVLLRVWVVKEYDYSIQKERAGGLRRAIGGWVFLMKYLKETFTREMDFDAEGENFYPRLGLASVVLLSTLGLIGAALVLPPIVYNSGSDQLLYSSFAGVVLFGFLVCLTFMGLTGDPTVAFARYSSKVQHEQRMQNVYQGGGKLNISQAKTGIDECARWEDTYVSTWFKLRNKYSGIRHTLIWFFGTMLVVVLLVLVPLLYVVSPEVEGETPDLFWGASTLVSYGVVLWLGRHLLVLVGGHFFNLHQAYAPSGHILQGIIKVKNEICLFVICLVLVPVAASLLKTVSFHSVAAHEDHADHGIQCYSLAFPPVSLSVSAPTPAPKYMHDDDDIIRELFKISLDCDEPVMKLVQVFVAGMAAIVVCVLLLLFWIVKSSVTEMNLDDQAGNDAKKRTKLSYRERLRDAIAAHVCVRKSPFVGRLIGQQYVNTRGWNCQFCWDTAGMAFLFKPYKLSFCYWKVFHLTHRVLVVLVVIGLEPHGTQLQLRAAFGMLAIFVVASFICHPFLNLGDWWHELLTYAALGVNVLAGIGISTSWISRESPLLNLVLFWTNVSVCIMCVLVLRPHILTQFVRRLRATLPDRAVMRTLFGYVKQGNLDLLILWNDMLPISSGLSHERDPTLEISRAVEQRARQQHVSVRDARSPFNQNLLHAAALHNLPKVFSWLLDQDRKSMPPCQMLGSVDSHRNTPFLLTIKLQTKEWREEQEDLKVHGKKKTSGNSKLDAVLKYDPNSASFAEGKFANILALITKARLPHAFGGLQTVDFSGQHALTQYGESSVIIKAICASGTKITDLNLANTMLGDLGARELAEMFAAGEGSMERLDLSGNKISPKGKQIIADALLNRKKCKYHLQYLLCDQWSIDHGVTALDISCKKLRMEDGLLLAAVLQSNHELTYLNASDNELAWGGQQAIVALAKAAEQHAMLHTLNLSKNFLKSEGFKAIHNLVRKERITNLSIAHNQINTEAVAWVAKACKCVSSLTSLDLSDNELVVFDEDHAKVNLEGLLSILRALKKNRLLNRLDLSRNSVGGWKNKQELKDLAQYLQLSSTITTMCLSGNNLNEVDVMQLSDGLKGNTTITRLNLANNRICVHDQSGLCSLAEALRGGRLKYLDLSRNALCGVQHIPGTRHDEASRVAALLPHKRQTDMGLYRLEGVHLLCQVLAQEQQINTLDLSFNKLHVAGVKVVADLVARSASLKQLGLAHTTMTLDRKSAHDHAKDMAKKKDEGLTTLVAKRNLWKVAKQKVFGTSRMLGGNGGPKEGHEKKETAQNSVKWDGKAVELFTEERSYEGLTALCDAMKRNPSTTVLDLSGNQLQDEGLHIFASLLHVGRMMERVDLRENEAGRYGAEALLNSVQDNHAMAVIADTLVQQSIEFAPSQQAVQVLAHAYREALSATALVRHCAAVPLNDLRRDRLTILEMTAQQQGVAEAVLIAGIVRYCPSLNTLILKDNDIASVRMGHPSPKSREEAEHRRKAKQRERRLMHEDPDYQPPIYFDASGVKALCLACNLNHGIKVLDLRGNTLGEDGSRELLRGLARNTSLELVSEVPIKCLRNAASLASKVNELANQWCKCSTLTKLVRRVCGGSASAADRAALAKYKKTKVRAAKKRKAMKSQGGWLDELELINKELGDCEALLIAHYVRPLDLRNLDLRGNYFGVAGANALLKALSRKQSVFEAQLQNSGNIFVTQTKEAKKQAHLASIAHNHTLEKLCGIPIVQLRANSLRTLDLSGCKLGEELGVGGGVLLAAVLKLDGSAIINLNVSNNLLGGRKSMRGDLGGMTPSGVLMLGKVLAKWPWKDTLKSSNIRNNNVDAETKERLVAAIGDSARV